MWDRDFPAAPALITITKDGQRRDIVAQIGKNGRTYVLDRETGEPVFPMEELQVPPSDVPGERLSPTRRLPVLPPPFTRQKFTEDLITTRTPAAHKAVREQWEALRKGGEYDPPSTQGTVLFPGMDGGGEWGGVAFDPASGLLYVNANEMAWRVGLAERKLPDGKPTSGKALYDDPDGFPAITPPWGTLTAIDMNTASIAWQVPFGEVPGSGIANSGSENYGGPVVTASGLLFIGATVYDKKFRAFDAKTGKVLWETTLPAAGNATPAGWALMTGSLPHGHVEDPGAK